MNSKLDSLMEEIGSIPASSFTGSSTGSAGSDYTIYIPGSDDGQAEGTSNQTFETQISNTVPRSMISDHELSQKRNDIFR